MSLKDHFRIGSNTKTMTSTVILQLVEEGKLKLNDPIGKFVTGVPNGNKITIRELSEMRSGLFSYTFDPGFNATLDRNPKKGWTSGELLKIAFTHKPNFAPGQGVRILQHQHRAARRGDRKADRDERVAGVRGTDLQAARA